MVPPSEAIDIGSGQRRDDTYRNETGWRQTRHAYSAARTAWYAMVRRTRQPDTSLAATMARERAYLWAPALWCSKQLLGPIGKALTPLDEAQYRAVHAANPNYRYLTADIQLFLAAQWVAVYCWLKRLDYERCVSDLVANVSSEAADFLQYAYLDLKLAIQ